LGWDTDQFPNSVEEMSLGVYEILRAGGFTTGGFNFDTKLRRMSIARDDLFHAHIGGMDTLARSLLVAHAMLDDGVLEDRRARRYEAWGGSLGSDIHAGTGHGASLAALHDLVAGSELDPEPVSGRQEELENLVNRYIERTR
jgi:xylose isomerase